MEIPKVLWLKNNMDPPLFSRCQFFDLPDYLTYRATNDSTRSCCSLTCKCSYVPKSGWQPDFFKQIGLEELVVSEYKQVGAVGGHVLAAGQPVGHGLSKTAANELGLLEGTPVGSGLIDAYVYVRELIMKLIAQKICWVAWNHCCSVYRERNVI